MACRSSPASSHEATATLSIADAVAAAGGTEGVVAGSGRIERRDDARPVESAPPEQSRPEAARDLLDGVEDLLDEIDEVLEENAEEFVRGYVQKGGE